MDKCNIGLSLILLLYLLYNKFFKPVSNKIEKTENFFVL